MHIVVAGYPSSIGGANTELWHTLKLWRSGGIDVTCLALKDRPSPEWISRVGGIGCKTVIDKLDNVGMIRGLPDSIVVAFCNYWFITNLRRFDLLRCKIVWVPCMNWPFPDEQLWHKVCGMMDAYVYQSTYQAAQMMPLVQNWCKRGNQPYLPDRCHQIRGAFDVEEFPFGPKPVVEGEPFVIGRLSRSVGKPANHPALEKYPIDIWSQYAAIRARIPHLKARVMGWNAGIEDKCGPPPEWAEVLPDCAETVQEFLASLHCLVPGIGCCTENWPRVGLEAMAAGVPLVVEAKGGWPEMTAYTAEDRAAQTNLVAGMAGFRNAHLTAAELSCERVLVHTDPARILGKWRDIFNELENR
jgi:hypothetical protein